MFSYWICSLTLPNRAVVLKIFLLIRKAFFSFRAREVSIALNKRGPADPVNPDEFSEEQLVIIC
jgi:hypothetical protein